MYIVTLLCTVVTCIMHDVCALHHAMLLTFLWCDTCMLRSVLDIANMQVLTSSSTLTSCLPPFCCTPLPLTNETGKASMAVEGYDHESGKSIRAMALGKLHVCSICTLILFSYMHVHCDIVVDCCYMYYA